MSDFIELFVHKRGCGWPKEGGTYLVSEDASPNGTLARIVKIDPPIPTQRKPHRGPILVDGAKIMARLPEDEWVVGSSAKTVERKRADEVWVDMFGMSLKQRLSTGECYGMKTGEEAYQHLMDTVKWSRKAVDFFRQLAIQEVQNLPNVAPIYLRMTRTIQNYVRTRGADANDLVQIGAMCWEIYYAVPARKRSALTPLPYLLSSIGLVKDGREMLLAIAPA